LFEARDAYCVKREVACWARLETAPLRLTQEVRLYSAYALPNEERGAILNDEPQAFVETVVDFLTADKAAAP